MCNRQHNDVLVLLYLQRSYFSIYLQPVLRLVMTLQLVSLTSPFLEISLAVIKTLTEANCDEIDCWHHALEFFFFCWHPLRAHLLLLI